MRGAANAPARSALLRRSHRSRLACPASAVAAPPPLRSPAMPQVPLPASGPLAPPPSVRAAVEAAPWRGGLEPCGDFSASVTDTAGVLPAALRGTLLRVGPSRIRVGPTKYAHWFDGDGGVLKISLGGAGGVTVAYKAVQTERVVAQDASPGATQAGSMPSRGAWTQATGGLLRNAFRLPTNPANVAPLVWGGKTAAACEGGAPVEVAPSDLATLGVLSQWNRGGALGFGAHFKVDERTNVLYNLGMLPVGGLRVFALNRAGEELRAVTIPLPKLAFVHDFAQTVNFLVIIVPPWLSSPLGAVKSLLGLTALGQTFTWDADAPSRVVVLRKADLSVVLDTSLRPAISLYHFSAAWEEDGGGDDGVTRIVAQVSKHIGPRADLEANFGDMYSAVWEKRHMCELTDVHIELDAAGGGRVARVVPTTGGASLPMEFASSHPTGGSGTKPRFVYSLGFSGAHPNGWWDAIQKDDLCAPRGTPPLARRFPPNIIPSEPIFVPDPSAGPTAAEDAGWLLTVVYKTDTHTSELHVLDARGDGLAADSPLFVARLPRHVPYTFHGCWVPAAA